MWVPRVSVRGLLFATLLIAADMAALRLTFCGYPSLGLSLGMLGVLPMANLLAILGYRNVCRRTHRRPFFAGFVVTGALTLLGYFHLCLSADDRQLVALNIRVARLLDRTPGVTAAATLIANHDVKFVYYAIINVTYYACLTTLPMIVLALTGGWAIRRFAAPRVHAAP
jgi:hypothetical protein